MLHLYRLDNFLQQFAARSHNRGTLGITQIRMEFQIDNDIKLSLLRKDDAKDIFQLIDSEREYLGKWLPFIEKTKELGYTEGFVNAVVDSPVDNLNYTFTIRTLDKLIGIIGFKDTDVLNKKTEIGYWLSESFQKRGIVTKSVERLCLYAFTELGINRIQIKCAVGNEPSKKIPKRLGFKFEGIERDGELLSGDIFTDIEVYSKLKGEFEK